MRERELKKERERKREREKERERKRGGEGEREGGRDTERQKRETKSVHVEGCPEQAEHPRDEYIRLVDPMLVGVGAKKIRRLGDHGRHHGHPGKDVPIELGHAAGNKNTAHVRVKEEDKRERERPETQTPVRAQPTCLTSEEAGRPQKLDQANRWGRGRGRGKTAGYEGGGGGGNKKEKTIKR